MFSRKSNKRHLQAVIIPIIPEKNDGGFYNSQHAELLQHARHVLKIIKHNKEKMTYNAILYLGDRGNIHGIQTVLPFLINNGSELFVVAHGTPEYIGTAHNYGITPEELADFFAMLLNKEGYEIKHIKLLSCNSGYKREGSTVLSYAERFKNAMHQFGYIQLSVSGYIGFIGEIAGKSHTYVTALPYKEDPTQRLFRAEESEIIFKADGSIIPPKRKVIPKLASGQNRDFVFDLITQRITLPSIISTNEANQQQNNHPPLEFPTGYQP